MRYLQEFREEACCLTNSLSYLHKQIFTPYILSFVFTPMSTTTWRSLPPNHPVISVTNRFLPCEVRPMWRPPPPICFGCYSGDVSCGTRKLFRVGLAIARPLAVNAVTQQIFLTTRFWKLYKIWITVSYSRFDWLYEEIFLIYVSSKAADLGNRRQFRTFPVNWSFLR